MVALLFCCWLFVPPCLGAAVGLADGAVQALVAVDSVLGSGPRLFSCSVVASDSADCSVSLLFVASWSCETSFPEPAPAGVAARS